MVEEHDRSTRVLVIEFNRSTNYSDRVISLKHLVWIVLTSELHRTVVIKPRSTNRQD